jgi:hypothetical protein
VKGPKLVLGHRFKIMRFSYYQLARFVLALAFPLTVAFGSLIGHFRDVSMVEESLISSCCGRATSFTLLPQNSAFKL